MRKPKRVRFSGGEMDGVHVHDSPERSKADESSRFDGPKTLYFRKFKGGDVHDHSRSRHKENEKLKRSKISSLITDTSGAFGTPIEPSRKDLKISVSGERASAADHNNIFLSPRIGKYSVLDQRSKGQTEKCEKMASLIHENATPVGQCSFSSPSTKDSGNEYNEKGIFSAKRDRLRKLAAQTLFSESEIIHPKRFDFVTALMSRLFPKDNETIDSSKEDTVNCSKSLVVHKSNNLDKGLQSSSKKDWDMEVPKMKSGRSNEIIRPEWDSFVSGYSIPNHGTESRVHYLLDQQHPKSWSPYDISKSSSSFIFKGLDEHCPSGDLHRSLLEWNHGKGKDSLDSSIFNVNYAGFPTSKIDQKRFSDNVINAKRPCLLSSNNFLEVDLLPHARDFGSDFDDVECALAEPRLSTSLNIDQKRCTDNVINAKGPSLLFSNHVLELGSLPHVPDFATDFDAVECALAEPVLSTLDIDKRRFTDTVINAKGPSLLFPNHFLELDSLPYERDFRSGFDDVKCALTEPGWLSLTLPKCITLGVDDRNEENIFCNQSILWDGKLESDSRIKCLTTSDFSTEDYCCPPVFHTGQYPQDDSSLLVCSFSRPPGKSIITPFSEGAFFNRDLLPSNHEYSSSLGAFRSIPLLLDRVSCDRPNEINELEYR